MEKHSLKMKKKKKKNMLRKLEEGKVINFQCNYMEESEKEMVVEFVELSQKWIEKGGLGVRGF